MFLNPLARLVSSIMLFLILIILLEDWIVINIRGCIKRWRDKHNRRINKW
jgi:uncharacterized membrane protein